MGMLVGLFVFALTAHANPQESFELRVFEQFAGAGKYKNFDQVIKARFKGQKKESKEVYAWMKKNKIKPGARPPKMQVRGPKLYVGGYPRAITVAGLNPLKLNIDQANWSFESTQTATQNLDALKGFLTTALPTEKTAGLIRLLIPEAQADGGDYAAAAVGALVFAFSGQNPSDLRMAAAALAEEKAARERGLGLAEEMRKDEVRAVMPDLRESFCLGETNPTLNAHKTAQFRKGNVPKLESMTIASTKTPATIEMIWDLHDGVKETVEYTFEGDIYAKGTVVKAKAREGKKVEVLIGLPLFRDWHWVSDKLKDGSSIENAKFIKRPDGYGVSQQDFDKKIVPWTMDEPVAQKVILGSVMEAKVTEFQMRNLRRMVGDESLFGEMCNEDVMKSKLQALLTTPTGTPPTTPSTAR